MLGNVVLWKPSPMAMLSNYLVYQIFREAGMPPGVIQFVPGGPERICKVCFSSSQFSALHFTGSTKVEQTVANVSRIWDSPKFFFVQVFKQLWKDIAQNLDIYRSYPRIVGETGETIYLC
jgi:1-pyrroline-5-carboxylate dehydrogenase